MITRKYCLTLFFAFLLASVSHSALAQLNQRVTLHVKNAGLKELLDQIQKQTSLNFVYKSGLTAKMPAITLNANNELVSTVLNRAFEGTGFSYILSGSILTLKYADPKPKNTTPANFTVVVRVTDEKGQEKLGMATCSLKPQGIFVLTDGEGTARFNKVAPGEAVLEVTFLGYEKATRTLVVNGNEELTIKMQHTSLKIRDLSVVAKSSSGGVTTESKIERQAIDHLQAMSLADVMQLIPGNLMTNTDLTSKSNLQIRTLANNSTNAFGSSVMVDGIPISSNANMGIKGDYSQTAFTGVDLRQVSTDNIESVEIIRGIPSAEYGDLTSGAVIVNTKSGQTPWEVRAKVNPSTMNYSLDKGFKLGKKAGVLNTSLDYAQAWGDPRMKTKSFDRYSASLAYTYDFSKSWRTTTKVSYSGLIDWSGKDPDQVDDGTYVSEKNQTVSVNHLGKISLNKPWSRTIKYSAGYSRTDYDYKLSKIVNNSSGFMPILTATETGYFQVPYEAASYKASGGSKSNPVSFFVKASNSFYCKTKGLYQLFNTGFEGKKESNNGIGYYNDNNRYPLQPNYDGRPRPYYDIPGLTQLAAYAEDNMRFKVAGKNTKIQLGIRYTMLQPGKAEQVQSLSPRLNSSVTLTPWLEIRAGYGISSKTPGLIHLYPDKSYSDRVAANYNPVNNPAGQLLMYNTNVYKTPRSKGLQNANNKKIELGADIRLPGDRKLSVIAYRDEILNGFGSLPGMYTYTSNYYETGKGLVTTPGGATTVDWSHPARTDTLFSSTGQIGNTNAALNKGLELDFNLGTIERIHTSFYLTGAWMETQTWTTGISYSTPSGLPANYATTLTTPFKLEYPALSSKDIYKRFSTNLRMVSHLPELGMVVSFATQVIWFNQHYTSNQKIDPVAWIDTDLSRHEISLSMLNTPDYRIKGVLLSKQRRNPKDNPLTRDPAIALMTARLTKEIGSNTDFSFYANNFLYHEPFMHNNVTTTLSQRNEGTFSFGAELSFHF